MRTTIMASLLLRHTCRKTSLTRNGGGDSVTLYNAMLTIQMQYHVAFLAAHAQSLTFLKNGLGRYWLWFAVRRLAAVNYSEVRCC